MTDKPHTFKSGYTRPFRANCKRCGLTKQDSVHDITKEVTIGR